MASVRTITVGRAADNDIVLDDDQVSRHHCRVIERRGCFLLTDLDSQNGTRVEGRRVHHETLVPGDRIGVGSHQLLLATDGTLTVQRRAGDDGGGQQSESHPPVRRSSRTLAVALGMFGAVLLLALAVPGTGPLKVAVRDEMPQSPDSGGERLPEGPLLEGSLTEGLPQDAPRAPQAAMAVRPLLFSGAPVPTPLFTSPAVSSERRGASDAIAAPSDRVVRHQRPHVIDLSSPYLRAVQPRAGAGTAVVTMVALAGPPLASEAEVVDQIEITAHELLQLIDQYHNRVYSLDPLRRRLPALTTHRHPQAAVALYLLIAAVDRVGDRVHARIREKSQQAVVIGGTSGRGLTAELVEKLVAILETQLDTLSAMKHELEQGILQLSGPALGASLREVVGTHDEALVRRVLEQVGESEQRELVGVLLEVWPRVSLAGQKHLRKALKSLTGQTLGTHRKAWLDWWNETERTQP